jgi:hypothetical protein
MRDALMFLADKLLDFVTLGLIVTATLVVPNLLT